MTTAKNYSALIYFLLWCLYYLQGVLYTSGGIISKALLGVLLLLSTYHVIRVYLMGSSKQLRWLGILMIMFIVYGIVGVISGEDLHLEEMSNVGYVKNILISFLPIYSFFYYTKKGDIDSSTLSIWTIILMAVYILSFINHREVESSDFMMAALNDIDQGTNNAGYLVVSLVPFLIYLNKKPIVQYTSLALIMLLVISSMKRGAILVGAIMMVIFVFSSVIKRNTRNKVLILIMVVVVAYAGVQYVGHLVTTSDFFNARLQSTLEGDTSTRDVIYSFFFHYFINQTSIVSLLFGSGASATARLYGIFAHNDWVEIAIDQGVLGLFIYLSYWISLIKSWRTTSFDKMVYLSFGLSLLYLLFRSFVSMSFLMIPLSCTILLGYGLAKSGTTTNIMSSK